jgi:2-deoxy-D-gluconate 3-dehydrogenase
VIDFQLEGKVAIVTGASRGLGRAAAEALVEQGALVLAVARSIDELQKLETAHPGKIKACQCDMSDIEVVAGLPAQAIDAFGQLDIVVNNAGIAPAGFFLEQDDQVWLDVMAVNVTAPAILTKAAGKYMLSQGSGKIINIASTSGILGKPMLVAYSSSKGALLQFTKALAGEWARKGVQVNAIAPGAFATDAQRVVLESPDILARRLGKIPAKRMGTTEEIGPMICYLASSLSDFVSGSVFVIDGGESSKL